MRKPVRSTDLYVVPKGNDDDPQPPHPAVVTGHLRCAPELEPARARILQQWLSGVSMKSLAAMYSTPKDEIERVSRERLIFEYPMLQRRAA